MVRLYFRDATVYALGAAAAHTPSNLDTLHQSRRGATTHVHVHVHERGDDDDDQRKESHRGAPRPVIPALQAVSLTLNASAGWVYIYDLKKNISISGIGSLSVDPDTNSVFASASAGDDGPPQSVQSVRLDGRTGERVFTNIRDSNSTARPATMHDAVYARGEPIGNPDDLAFCNFINPRPCDWQLVLEYWASFVYDGEIEVNGQTCNKFAQAYSYGGAADVAGIGAGSSSGQRINRTVELAFYPNGTLARLNHTEHQPWGITHSVDLAQDISYPP